MVRTSFAAAVLMAAFLSSGILAQDTASEQAAPKAASQKSLALETAAPAASEASSKDEEMTKLSGKVDGIEEDYLATKSTVDKLSKLVLSGYMQVQYRSAVQYTGATNNVSTSSSYGNYLYSKDASVGQFAGGAFPNRVSDLLEVRRARVKLGYATELTSFSLQLDATPFQFGAATYDSTISTSTSGTVSAATAKATYLSKPGVQLKEASVRFTEPWLKSFAIKAGIFDRPFGFEVNYSSGDRESPEISRVIQTLMPSEQDVGAQLEYIPSENLPSILQLFNLKIGGFDGNAIAVETDSYRDVIGRFGITLPLTDINLNINAGVSGYAGKVLDLSDSVYTMSSTAFTGTKGNLNTGVDRTYTGVDAQISYGEVPLLGGCTLRGEFIQGKQPGSSSSTISVSNNVVSNAAIYERNFMGYYVMLVQNIDPIKSQLLLKYDSYDPNTDISGTDIGVPGTGTGAADMMFNTLGIGGIYRWDANVQFLAYYDKVMNENISVAPYKSQINDNVFTFRIQYKF